MTLQTTQASPRFKARLAGVLALIDRASGGVGTMAVQIAKSFENVTR